MTSIRGALSSLAVVGLAGCGTLQVQTDYDAQASFGQLATYSWIDQTVNPGTVPAVHSPLVEQRLRRAVDGSLERMGYRRSTNGTPDFQVAYRITTERETTADARYGYGSYGYGSYHRFSRHRRLGRGRYGFGYDPYYYGYDPYGLNRGYEYVQATLVLDVVDARTNKLIWRGWATGKLDHDPKPEAVQEYVNEAVEKILERFPRRTLTVDGASSFPPSTPARSGRRGRP